MTAMAEKTSPQERTGRRVALVTGWALALAVPAALLIWTSVSLGDAIFALVVVGLPFAMLVMQFRYGPTPPPLGYKKRPLDWQQWQRWRFCLLLGPTLLTGFAAQALAGVREWLEPEPHWPRLLMAAAFPVLAFGLTNALILGRRGKPGSAVRRDFEDLNDELSRAHAGIAYRDGFRAAFVGLIAIGATAMLAPRGVLFAVTGACWLASVTTLIRFGLLQRAAEPMPGEAEG